MKNKMSRYARSGVARQNIKNRKIAVSVLSLLFFFVGGLNLVQAKPSWCSMPKDTAIEYSGISENDWQKCCVRGESGGRCGGEATTTGGGCNEAECSKQSGCIMGAFKTYKCAPNNLCEISESRDCPNGCKPDGSACKGEVISQEEWENTYGAGPTVPITEEEWEQRFGAGSSGGGGYSSTGGGGIMSDLDALAAATGLPNPFGGVKGVLMNVLNWMLGIFGALALLAFVISGIMYMTAAGETDKIGKAKTMMTWSIVGVIVGLGGVVVIQTIDYLLQ